MEKQRNLNLVFKASFLFAVLFLCVSSQAEVIYVDDSAFGTNDGSSWTDAYNYLQDALAIAVSGDEIRVAQGTYTPDMGGGNTPGDRSATFQLINGVTIQGGYAGLDLPDPNARGIDIFETVLNGDLNGDDSTLASYSDNSLHVVTGSYIDETAVLDGFTITAGYCYTSDSNENPQSGAGMIIETGSPTISSCTFQNNINTAICHYSGSLMLRDCLFSNNSSGYDDGKGGGIANYDEIILYNCIFNENTASYGGGMWNSSIGTAVLYDCSFSQNSANSEGGGIYNEGQLPQHEGQGGQLTLYNCTLTANTAGSGGGIYSSSKYINLYNCVFNRNTTDWNGGGIYCSIEAKIYNCVFSGNTTSFLYTHWAGGAAMVCRKGDVVNCTFTGNRGAGIIGKGMIMSGDLNITGCIIWDNTTSVDFFVNEAEVTYSNIQGGFPGVANIDVDPCFVNPGYWADANNTNIIIDPNNPNAIWVEGDYHLKSQAGRWDDQSQSWVIDDVDSLCIDAGDPNSPIGLEPFPNGGIYNMGAYGRSIEASKTYFGKPVCDVILAGDINGDCIVDDNDLNIVVSQWLLSGEDFKNKPPTVTLIEPQDGDQITWPGPTILKAEADDIDGDVVEIEFRLEYMHPTKTYSISIRNSPGDQIEYEYDWTRRKEYEGQWIVWVEATDNEGAVGKSQEITITLNAP